MPRPPNTPTATPTPTRATRYDRRAPGNRKGATAMRRAHTRTAHQRAEGTPIIRGAYKEPVRVGGLAELGLEVEEAVARSGSRRARGSCSCCPCPIVVHVQVVVRPRAAPRRWWTGPRGRRPRSSWAPWRGPRRCTAPAARLAGLEDGREGLLEPERGDGEHADEEDAAADEEGPEARGAQVVLKLVAALWGTRASSRRWRRRGGRWSAGRRRRGAGGRRRRSSPSHAEEGERRRGSRRHRRGGAG